MLNEDHKLCESMKSLDIITGQDILALQETVVKIFEMIEEIIKTDEQRVEIQRQDLTLLVYVRGREDLSRVLVN